VQFPTQTKIILRRSIEATGNGGDPREWLDYRGERRRMAQGADGERPRAEVAAGALSWFHVAAHTSLLDRLAAAGIGGGRTDDAVIAAAAAHANVGALLTFNPRHFDPPPEGVTVVQPPA
jgi:predicted nucleic acid-binding protein